MFLEVNKSRTKIRRWWKNISSIFIQYSTRLSRSIWNRAICILEIQNDTWLKVGHLWTFSYELLLLRNDIKISECAPFWGWIHLARGTTILDSKQWRSVLLSKWIAWAIEFLLLYPEQESHWDFCIIHSSTVTDMREKQLKKYRLNRRLKIRNYLNRLKATIQWNPHFRVIKPLSLDI